MVQAPAASAGARISTGSGVPCNSNQKKPYGPSVRRYGAFPIGGKLGITQHLDGSHARDRGKIQFHRLREPREIRHAQHLLRLYRRR